MATDSFLGWRLAPGAPFSGELFLTNSGRSHVLIGPNGFGKSKLLAAVRDPRTVRVFSKLPHRLQLIIAQDLSQEALPPAALVGNGRLERWRQLVADVDKSPDHAWGLQIEAGMVGRIFISTVNGEPTGEGSWQIPAEAVTGVIEPWLVPEAQDASALRARTRSAFEDWIDACGSVLQEPLVRSRNPLIARDAAGRGVSLLQVSERFASTVALRTSLRVAALVGFAVDIRVRPEDDFLYEIRLGTPWFALERGSSALRRWVSLAASESLWELVEVAREAARFPSDRTSADRFLGGDVPEVCFPRSVVRGFVSRSSWIMMDEPEIHLFGSEAQKLGSSLAGASLDGRLIIATHSLELASSLVGRCDFLTFSAPGEYVLSTPDGWVDTQLRDLAAQGPGALAGMRVLYVEGVWDAKFIEFLYEDELRAHRVLICPTHGTLGASAVVSSVWQRLTGAPFGVMFDALESASVNEAWTKLRSTPPSERSSTIRSLRTRANRPTGLTNEDLGLLKVQANILESGMEERVRFVMHGLSDIFQLISPSAFGAPVETWAQLGLRPRESLKRFVLTRYGRDLGDGRVCNDLFNRLCAGDVKFDQDALSVLDHEIRSFFSWEPEHS